MARMAARIVTPFSVTSECCHCGRSPSWLAVYRNQDQFILEGMVVGIWNVMTGISFAMAVVLGSGKRNRIVQFVGA